MRKIPLLASVSLAALLASPLYAQVASSSAPPVGKPTVRSLHVVVYTSREVAGMANSFLICADKDAILFDVVQTRTDASRLADMVDASGKRLTTIFISHAHPDHYLGLDVLATRFPNARIAALPEVVQDIKTSGPALQKLLQARWGTDGPERLVVPEPLDADTITLEGMDVRVLRFGGGESAHLGALFLPQTGDLFCGDLVYNQFHLFLREKRVDDWLAILDEFAVTAKKQGVLRIFPGHGRPASRDVIEANRQYLRDFRQALTSGSRADVQKTMLARYPDYAMSGFLTGFTLDAYFPAPLTPPPTERMKKP
ncbi:MAG: MBL fold metallo-hydrolase [Fibrella sp.]|nr:MBL fold metallo-hydrolase [Armatimonadota bacterium]